MKRSFILMMVVGLVSVVTLVACNQQSQGTAVGTIEAYLVARVGSDEARLLALSCKAWEGSARDEAASFKSMSPNLQSMSCSQSGQEGQFTLVACKGKIVTTYQGESRDWPLERWKFLAIIEDGQWKMCGYQGNQ
jgi:hypothetical protein